MLRTFFLAPALLLVAGCFGLGPRPAPPPFGPNARTAITTEVPANEWVARAIAAAARLESLEMQGKMKVVDPGNDFHLRCNVQALIARPDRIRLLATKGLGTEVLDLALAGGSVDIWVPRRKLFLRGRLDDLRETGVRFDPQEIIEHLILPIQQYRDASWRILAQSEAALAVQTRDAEGVRERLTVDPRDGALLRRERFDQAGAALLDVAYSRHRDLPGGPKDERYPHRMRLHFPREDRSLTLVIIGLDPSRRLVGADFRLLVPPGAEVRPLNPAMARQTEAAVRDALESPASVGAQPDGPDR